MTCAGVVCFKCGHNKICLCFFIGVLSLASGAGLEGEMVICEPKEGGQQGERGGTRTAQVRVGVSTHRVFSALLIRRYIS